MCGFAFVAQYMSMPYVSVCIKAFAYHLQLSSKLFIPQLILDIFYFCGEMKTVC